MPHQFKVGDKIRLTGTITAKVDNALNPYLFVPDGQPRGMEHAVGFNDTSLMGAELISEPMTKKPSERITNDAKSRRGDGEMWSMIYAILEYLDEQAEKDV